MPKAERPPPPYAQIATHYREAILNQEMAPGQRLPSITDLAAEWGVSASTAAKAISQLQVEGVIYTSPQGSFVAEDEVISKTPQDRVRASAPRRSVTNGEHVEVTAAEIVVAPNYVAELLGIPIGSDVVRREEITHRKGRPRMLSVDWIPGTDAITSADLLAHQPVSDGAIRMVERGSGRRASHGHDHLRGRAGDARECGALRLPIGSPVLAGAHLWSDDDGVLLYGEWVMPPDQVVSYQYEIELPAG
jgi:GntR family transcriptional regulator